MTAAGMGLYFGTRDNNNAFTGNILGASHDLGHRLRTGSMPSPLEERKVPVVIVGGGVSGLCAAWKLAKAGFRDFEILELEPECGGNSRYGENSITRYPWGAHYVPLPTQESHAVRELFTDLGVLEGYGENGEPHYKEEYLCHSPQERLYIHGRWQEGVLPTVAITSRDLEQYKQFRDLINDYKQRRGSDSRKAFAIPMELSSKDREFVELDNLSMREFLLSKGLDSVPLHWYANYACRDDYGTDYREVSAWAGLHYFASRDAVEASDENSVLTWPEGNGWIVRNLLKRLDRHTKTSCLVYRVHPLATSAVVEYFDARSSRSVRVIAEHVVLACPHTFNRFLLRDISYPSFEAFQYAPWMVANLSLRGFPIERVGVPLAWDNVIYDSSSLGYVVATHQSLRTYLAETVLTYYYPLTASSAKSDRQRLLTIEWSEWADIIVNDLSKPHPEISKLITRLDVFRWGHAMVRPTPGFLFGHDRQKAAQSLGMIHFAHSDLSGFSIFEEAQYRGILAAEKILNALQIPFSSSLL